MSQYGDRGLDTGRSTSAVPCRIENLQSFLHGPWRFERKVHDTLIDQQGDCLGDASFLADGDKLIYREEGELKMGDIETNTEREYHYTFPAPSLAEVRFPDGRFFHVLDLTKGIVRVEHQCGEDTYHGLSRVLSDKAWLSVWRVTGPKKNQVITTHYLRVTVS